MLKRKVPTWIAVVVFAGIVVTIALQVRGVVTMAGRSIELQTSKAAIARLALERTANRNR